MAKVEIFSLQNDGTQKTTVTCTEKDGVVVCEGNDNVIKRLRNEGILDYTKEPPQKIFPEAGRLFLEQLKNNFRSGYLNASEVQEEPNTQQE